MPSLRINSVTVQGFRSFREPQTLNLGAPLAAVFGSNSQGKTSLAEAIEFLLTGEIVRRQLMASAQDEFADALRNVHLPPQDSVFVEVRLLCADGAERTVRRTLVRDYGRGRTPDSETRLEIGGKPATEADLVAQGCILSPPPLRAPVLAQHTLGYLFSAKPHERAEYFRALLEATDLEELRTTVASLESETTPAATPILAKFTAASAVPELKVLLTPFLAQVPRTAALRAAFDQGAVALITAAGLPVPETEHERLDAVAVTLAQRRARIFPLQSHDYKPLAVPAAPDEQSWGTLDSFIAERSKVDDETRRLTALFKEALNLPVVAGATAAIDCPLCQTPAGLTTAQIANIRTRVAETEAYRTAEERASKMLERLRVVARGIEAGLLAACPAFLTLGTKQRRAMGFTVVRIRAIADAGDGAALIDAWLKLVPPLARRHRRAVRHAADLVATLGVLDTATIADTRSLKVRFEACVAAIAEVRAALDAYALADQALRAHLSAVIDTASNVKGWQEFLDLAADLATLREALVERAALTALGRDLARALTAIQRGNEQVADDKFGALSAGIDVWWNRLRPDEPTFFSAVKATRRNNRLGSPIRQVEDSGAARSCVRFRDDR